MIEYILFGLTTLSFIFIVLSIVFIWKEKEFEDKRLKGSVNCFIVGLSFLAIFLGMKAVQYFLELFNDIDISFYSSLVELIAVSLMVIFFLVGMMLMKEVH